MSRTIRKDISPDTIQVGSIVSIKPGSRYGLVKESFVHGDRPLFHVHYISPQTGKLMKCPDSRCDGGHTCPIHGTNCTEAQLVPFNRTDIDYLVQEGMIDPELLRG